MKKSLLFIIISMAFFFAGIRGSNEVIRTTVKPIKWFFTFNGGLAFRF